MGFARAITDFTTFAYLAYIFIIDSYKNKGLSKWLIKVILDHPSLQGLKRWMLSTKYAHGLYKKFGFKSPQHPDWIMEITNLDIYKSS